MTFRAKFRAPQSSRHWLDRRRTHATVPLIPVELIDKLTGFTPWDTSPNKIDGEVSWHATLLPPGHSKNRYPPIFVCASDTNDVRNGGSSYLRKQRHRGFTANGPWPDPAHAVPVRSKRDNALRGTTWVHVHGTCTLIHIMSVPKLGHLFVPTSLIAW